MANRLTKGKALIGSLDVQGELTVNGAPVGAGGGEGSGPELVYTMYVDPNNSMYNEQWAVGMGSRSIVDYNSMFPMWQQNFISGNNMQIGDKYIVTKAEWAYYNMMTGQFEWRDCAESYDWAGYNFYGVVIYDYMQGQNVLRMGTYGNATYGMQNSFRFTFKKKG